MSISALFEPITIGPYELPNRIFFAPGLYNAQQIERWQTITDAIHREGGRVFQQFWHSGRVTHQSLLPKNRQVKGPSAIGISRELVTYDGKFPATMPQALTLDEIAELRADYRQAAQNTLAAGFDAETGAVAIAAGKAMAIAYGRPWIANPDLPHRYRLNAPWNEVDPATIYGGDQRGYTDYPTLASRDVAKVSP